MKKIKFSVLMSVYKNDTVDNVKIAIESLLNQTMLPSQIVIISDGPIPAKLKDLLCEYEKNDLFDIYYRDVNLGLGPTLNEGLLKCKYDYVARMDADDESLPERFENQLLYLESHSDIDAVGTIVDEYDEEMNYIISKKCVPETSREINKYLQSRNPINHPTIVYKKSKVLEVNGYEDFPYFEDYYLWAKMICNGSKFYNIQKSLYKFRAGSSMIKRRGGKKYLSCIKKFEKALLDLGVIDKNIYYKNLTKRYIVSLLPNGLRQMLYMKLLRKSVKED